MRRRWVVLGLWLVATAVAGVFALNVGIDNSVEVWFVEDDPALKAYAEFQSTFGNDEVVVAAVQDNQGIWSKQRLNRLNQLTGELEAIDGVDRVYGVTRAKLIDGGLGSLEVTDAMAAGQSLSDADVTRIKKAITSDPVLRDRLVLASDTVALLFIQMARTDNIDVRRPGILNKINTSVSQWVEATQTPIYVAGIGVVYNELNRISQSEGAVIMGAAFGLIFILLWPLFRSIWAVLATILAVACALVMTRGLYGLFDRDENMVTMTLPVLVLIIGVADCIHIFRYRASHQTESAAEVLAKIVRPCLFTTLTTMVGFASLGTSKMALVRDLGIFASAGIGFAFLSSVIVCTFALSYSSFKIRPPSDPSKGIVGRFLH